jgi:membrane fusion protein (multidrug efflux system)
MHDVLKPTTLERKKKRRTGWIWSALFIVLFVAAVTGLVVVKTAMMIVVVAAVSALVFWFGLVAFRRFRLGRTTSAAVFAFLALFLLLIDVKALQISAMGAMAAKMAPPSTTVTSATVKEEDWAPRLTAVGSVSAVQGANVSTELAGVVSEINFENGAEAKKGEVLMKLDASQEEALLRSAEADAQLAKTDLERARDLAIKKVVSGAEFDSAQSKFTRMNAVVDQMRSNIAKKSIIAPFDGQLGIRQVNVGQMINAGQQVVALTALDPVYVDYALPEQYLSKLTKGLEVTVHADAFPGRQFKGKLTAINSMVDPVTRNVSLQATLENPDHALHPGMFAKVEVALTETKKTIVIPGSAVSYAPYGDSVFLIEKQKDPKTGKESQMLRQQFVRIGEARGDFVAVAQGLKAGQTVVSTGVFKLRNGMPVTVNNDLAPKPELNPKPADT